ncbi:MAG: phytanoyl-CoA dioxygenase family protein [Rhizobiaceae bacterium]|nr:phytanoyl-CoA dioxygenase family protein [Rhizobiaceae bacterium]
MTDVSRYGVKMATPASDIYDVLTEEVRLVGYTTLDAGMSEAELDELSSRFDDARRRYAVDAVERSHDLEKLGEQDAVRLLPLMEPQFWSIVFNKPLQQLLSRLLGGYFILNQVNGLINRGNQSEYHQAKYHRDLPYQHFTSSQPLAINALFALDDFSIENGATRVIPASQHREAFPPDEVVRRTQVQITVKRGTFIVLDCMLYHAGATNRTARDRRAINHVFTIPMLRQQFHLPSIIGDGASFSEEQRRILGFGLEEFRSLEDWLDDRATRLG